MGGDLDRFRDISMYDFQAVLAAHKIKSGIREDEEEVDLDDLYSALGESMKKNPNIWER